ncbi:MAG: putative transposase [Cyanobacteriota bacterium erpe_2018_sw_39hr_WHONDRS-SW48-000098_B_bin.30]|jgi:transposase-like protein|nr:transposase [Candidatus Obscuribacter sp.]MDQ5964948.1 putative transposase [Cyanobacteriota bacterium erpe_2018_sw_39hr_WHONDRS-SW48-000098_B_bin.30]
MEKARKKYSQEFKDSAVQLVLTGGKTAAAVAKELGLQDWQVRSWVRQAQSSSTTNGASDNIDKAEYERMKREHKRVLEENEILKKAAAFFAQHQR